MRTIVIFFVYLFISKSAVFAETAKIQPDENLSSAVVLVYHRFGNSKYPSTNIRIEQFEQHLKYIQDNGFTVWPLSKIVRYISEAKKLPNKTLALTIDDAYISTYTNAYPRLKAIKFPFTVFVSTSTIDAKSKNYMTWGQMHEMSLNGAEFANHSVTHDYLLPQKFETKDSWKKRVTMEIINAQKKLQDKLGIFVNENPKLFSYPFGEYNEELKNLLKNLGYVGITQTSGVVNSHSDLSILPRFAMTEVFANPKGFILKANTLPLDIESISPSEPLVTLQNPPLLQIKFKKAMKNLGCYKSDGERINIKWVSPTELQVQAKKPLQRPRDHYTCTAPARDGRWYWYSNLWIIK